MSYDSLAKRNHQKEERVDLNPLSTVAPHINGLGSSRSTFDSSTMRAAEEGFQFFERERLGEKVDFATER